MMLSSVARAVTATLLLVALCPVVSIAQNSNKVALITDLQGAVQVAPAGSDAYTKVEWGRQLFEGDKLKTLENAEASILFSNGNLISLGQNSSMTVSGSASGETSDKRPIKTSQGDYLADASDLTLYRAGPGEIGALGGLRSGGAPAALDPETPRNTRIITGQPQFGWSAIGDFDSFTVKVLSDEGVVWTADTEEHSIEYPSSAPKLVPGTRYFWQVEGEAMLNSVSSTLVSFEIVSSAELAKIEAGQVEIAKMFEDDAKGANHLFVLGSFYAREGLLGEAIDAFSQIAEKHPEASTAYEILGKLYYDVDRKDEAVKALQKAVQLEQKQ